MMTDWLDCINTTVTAAIFPVAVLLCFLGGSFFEKEQQQSVFMVPNLNRRLLPHPVSWESPHQPSDMLRMRSLCANKLDFRWAEGIRGERRVKFPWVENRQSFLSLWSNSSWLVFIKPKRGGWWKILRHWLHMKPVQRAISLQCSCDIRGRIHWQDIVSSHLSAFLNITFSIRTCY